MNVRDALDNIYKEFEKTYEEARKEGYLDGQANGYEFAEKFREEGMNLAWECARKIAEREDDMRNCFHDVSPTEVFGKYSASEAIAKIKEYEEKQTDEIKVGDEVTLGFTKGIVTRIEDHVVDILWGDGSTGEWCKDDFDKEFKKTGRHFSWVAKVLMQMQEDEE